MLSDERIRQIAEDIYCSEGTRAEIEHSIRAALAEAAQAPAVPVLTVWYGPMPETNGKTNWTAILHNGGFTTGYTLARSEYPDRVRYEADRVRHLIGETDVEPFILDYDADKHSGYVAPECAAQAPAVPVMGEAVAYLVPCQTMTGDVDMKLSFEPSGAFVGHAVGERGGTTDHWPLPFGKRLHF